MRKWRVKSREGAEIRRVHYDPEPYLGDERDDAGQGTIYTEHKRFLARRDSNKNSPKVEVIEVRESKSGEPAAIETSCLEPVD